MRFPHPCAARRCTSGRTRASSSRVSPPRPADRSISRRGRPRSAPRSRRASRRSPSRADAVTAAATCARRGSALAAAGAAGVLLCGCGARSTYDTWPLPNSNLAGTRAVASSAITAANVGRLRARWRFRLTASRASGHLRVDPDHRPPHRLHPGPSKHRLRTRPLHGSARRRASTRPTTGRTASRSTAAESSERPIPTPSRSRPPRARSSGSSISPTPSEQLVDIAPVVWHGLVFLSTIGYQPFGRGAIYALDERTGAIRWKFVTIAHPWPHPLEAGGGGLWYPVTIDAQGRLYAGNSNPGPWGGSPKLPNGAAFPRPGALLGFPDRARRPHRTTSLARRGNRTRHSRPRTSRQHRSSRRSTGPNSSSAPARQDA